MHRNLSEEISYQVSRCLHLTFARLKIVQPNCTFIFKIGGERKNRADDEENKRTRLRTSIF